MDPCGRPIQKDVNLRGPYLCSRAVLPGMVTRRRGRIINLASVAGLWTNTYITPYATSKCAVIRLSEILAAETKEYGISVFSIHPGVVVTAMVEEKIESNEDERWLGGFFRKNIDEGRDVPPERAAELALLLASGKADAFSGCYISVEDDVAALVQRAEEIQENDLYRLRLCT